MDTEKIIDIDEALRMLHNTNESKTYPLDINFGGMSITCFKDVFNPDGGAHDIIIPNLPAVNNEMSFLEIGTGTGNMTCGFYLKHKHKFKKIVTTDINPAAVANAKVNFEKFNVPAKVLLGDLFEPIAIDEKFDFIFWNHPFFYVPVTKELNLLEMSVADRGYENAGRFMAEVGKYLAPNGICLIGFSTDMGSLDQLHRQAEKSEKRLELFWSGIGNNNPLGEVKYELFEVKDSKV